MQRYFKSANRCSQVCVLTALASCDNLVNSCDHSSVALPASLKRPKWGSPFKSLRPNLNTSAVNQFMHYRQLEDGDENG